MATVEYKNMKVGPPRRVSRKDDPVEVTERWWKAPEGKDRGDAVVKAAMTLKDQQSERSQQNLMHARLYGNNDLASFGGRTYTNSMSVSSMTKIAINVVASGTDTLASKIAKSKPRASFTTSGGSWGMQQKARQLTKFMQAIFYEAKLYQVAVLQFLCACVFGTGALKIFLNDEGRVEIENAFIDELYVDDVDGKYGKPRQLFQRRMIDRDVLRQLAAGWKCDDDALEAIDNALVPEDSSAEKGFGDYVEVWEAWHLKSGAKAKDGIHSISIQGAELMAEAWDHPFFPFSFLRFKRKLLGFWGQGVPEILTGLQVSINRTIRSIDEQLRRKGKGRIFVQKGSKVIPAHLTNGIADILEYIGVAPTVDNQNAIASEDVNILQMYIKQAFQEIGVSQLSAAMQKPSGLDAQVAIREFTDIESERFSLLSQDWDQNFLQISEIAIALVSQNPSGYKVKLPNKRYIVEIDWKDIDLKRDDYIMQMFPTSSLPAHPGEKYQAVKERLADGMLSVDEAKRLLDFPDLEAHEDMANAAWEDAQCVIGYILDEATPRYEAPDQYQNIEYLMTLALSGLLYAKHHHAGEERLDMLRRMIDECSALKLAAAQAAAAPPPMPGTPAPGSPSPNMSGGMPMQQSQTVNMPNAPTVPPLIS